MLEAEIVDSIVDAPSNERAGDRVACMLWPRLHELADSHPMSWFTGHGRSPVGADMYSAVCQCLRTLWHAGGMVCNHERGEDPWVQVSGCIV